MLPTGLDEEDGSSLIVEPAHEGLLLSGVLRDGPLEYTDALRVLLDLINGLAHAHHHHRLHGGITPRSVLVGKEQGVLRGRLLDLGLAAAIGPEQVTPFGPVRVDLACAAPEVLKGEPLDPRADVYALGVVLHWMLAGKHPIHAPAGAALRLLKEAPSLLPSGIVDDTQPYLEDAIRAALGRALSKDPARRFGSVRALALALRPGGNLRDPGEPDPSAWPDPAPDGGLCAGSAQVIPPAGERYWDLRHSDRPFRCGVCGKAFSGASHWDARTFTCRACADRPPPISDEPPPEDLALVLEADERDPQVRRATERTRAATATQQRVDTKQTEASSKRQTRRAALRELLARESASNWLKVSPPETAGKPEAAEPEAAEPEAVKPEAVKPEAAKPEAAKPEAAKPSDGKPAAGRSLAGSGSAHRARLRSGNAGDEEVENAMRDAWADAKRRLREADDRRKETRVARPAPVKAGRPSDADAPALETRRPPPAMARPSSQLPPPSRSSGGGFSYALPVAVVLALVILIGAVKWSDDRAELQRQVEAVADLKQQLGQANQEIDRSNTEAFKAVQKSRRRREAAEEEAKSLGERLARVERERDELRAGAGKLETSREDLVKRLTEVTQARDRLGQELARSREEVARVERRARSAEAEVDTLRKAAKEGRARRKALAQRIVTLEEAETELAKVKKRAANLEGELLAAERARTRAAKDVARLEAELRTGKRALARLERAQTDLTARLEAARAQARTRRPRRVALEARTLAADGRSTPTASPSVSPVGSATLLLAVDEAQARPLLEGVRDGKLLLAVHVPLDRAPGWRLELAAQRLDLAAGPALPASFRPGSPREADGGVRFWIGALEARRLLVGSGGSVGFLLRGRGRGAPLKLGRASLVAIPREAK